MNTFARNHKPLEKAPDWIDKTWGERVSDCLMSLRLFGFITDAEHNRIFTSADIWYKEAGK